MDKPIKPALERAARALCRHAGNPENTQFEGNPMWQSYVPEAAAVLAAIRDPDMEMISAAADKATEIGTEDFAGIYRAMIDAASPQR